MARKDVAAIVSGAGWIAGFADKLIRELRQSGVSDEQIHSLVTDEGEVPVGKIAKVLAEHFGASRGDIFPVTIDYSKTLSEVITAGHYDWTNSDITSEHFPITGEGMVEVRLELAHFNKPMESEDVLKEFAEDGLGTARIEHLLAFGAKHPEFRRQFPIIALGSVWQDRYGYRFVPGLWSNADDRFLSLYVFDSRWSDNCRFLAFRK